MTNEDTVAALIDTSGVAGAWCEIDVKRLSDGTVIVWHDPTWARVADRSTLPAGISPTDPVRQATWSQVSQIRTKGGAAVATFTRMIDASATHGVKLLVEVRNDTLRNPASWISHAAQVGARVEYYQPVSSTCTTTQLDALRQAGATVGIKTSANPPCKLTSTQMQNRGVTLVVNDASAITTSYVSDMNAHGIRVFARGTDSSSAQATLNKGVARLMVDRPRASLAW